MQKGTRGANFYGEECQAGVKGVLLRESPQEAQTIDVASQEEPVEPNSLPEEFGENKSDLRDEVATETEELKEEMNEPTQVKEEPFSWEEKLAEAREKELEKKPKGNRFI